MAGSFTITLSVSYDIIVLFLLLFSWYISTSITVYKRVLFSRTTLRHYAVDCKHVVLQMLWGMKILKALLYKALVRCFCWPLNVFNGLFSPLFNKYTKFYCIVYYYRFYVYCNRWILILDNVTIFISKVKTGVSP